MRILIVEDEVGIAAFLKQGLEEESYSIDVAHDGTTGLQLAQSKHYDLLLLDWMLPGISGLEICKEFRKVDSKTPVIFLTAKDTLEETVAGLQAGANDYIKKPFHFEELLERVRVQLRPRTGGMVLTLGDIALNTETYQVLKGNQQISLTQKEFALLEFLMRNKGSVCKRNEIIEKVWDIHFDYNTSVIDVYINALRKKLMLTDEENNILTIRGIGYMAKEK